MLTYIRSRLGNADLAEDIAQETLVRLIGYCDANEVATIYGLGFRIARNLIADHFRSPARHTTELSDDLMCGDPTPEQIVAARQEVAQILDVLNAIPPLRREVLTRRRLQGDSCAAIARDLNLTPKAVEKHITRGVYDLGQRLLKLHGDD